MQIENDFCITEKEVGCTLGVSLPVLVAARKEVLIQGQDWARWVKKDRRIKYTKAAVLKVAEKLGIEGQAVPNPIDNGWLKARVLRANYTNPTIILCEVDGKGERFVRIQPVWRDLFLPKMQIEVVLEADGRCRTRKPRHRGHF